MIIVVYADTSSRAQLQKTTYVVCYLVATDVCAFKHAKYVLVYMFLGAYEVIMLFLQGVFVLQTSIAMLF